MKLQHIRIKDFRSFSGDHEFVVGDGVNYFVGQNNAGKSNVVRALRLALDPAAEFNPEIDRPVRDASSGGAPRKTRITLTFHLGSSGPERTLRERARAYEERLHSELEYEGGGTYAREGNVVFVTEFTSAGGRVTAFQAKGAGARSLPAGSEEHQRLLEQFRNVLRFAVVMSGDDLSSLLAGRFREILHMVISDHLQGAMQTAERAREDYLRALQSELLDPLRGSVEEEVGQLFPEISAAELIPAVPLVSETIASVEVRLKDAIATDLSEKGTGVRGAVLVSLLRYMAEQTRRSLVLAVEEPEAFLHPAAQEGVRSSLEELASRRDVSLLVTTHSPYIISHEPASRVTRLHKGVDGVTTATAAVSGDEPRGSLLGVLPREVVIARR